MIEGVIHRPPWQLDALCAQVGGDLWHAEKGEKATARAAKRICAMCPVAEECLEYALAHKERWGIWGGYSERERRKLERRAA